MSEGSERKGRLRPRKANTTYVHQLRNLRKSEQIKVEDSGPSSPEIQTPKIEDIFLPTPPSAAKHVVEHGKQPYLCLFCDRRFPLRQSLCKHMQRVHQRTSRRENNIRCPYCSQKEANVDKLFPHLVEYHASQYFACLTCFVRFPSATDLCHHLQTICSLHQIQTTAFVPIDIESPNKISANSLNKIQKKKKSRHADAESISVEKEPTHNLRSNPQLTGQDSMTAEVSHNEKSENINNNLQLDKNVIIILDDNSQLQNKPANSANDDNDKELILSEPDIAQKPNSYFEVDQGNSDKEFQDAINCFDDDFYSKVASNVQCNLTNYLDGTLTSLPFANSSEVELKECETVTVNSIDGFPTLLAVEQYAKGSEDLMQRRPILKHKWKTDASDSDRHGEYDKQIDTLKNNGGHLPQCILPLISGLDIWTQIQMRKKYEDVSLYEQTNRSKRKLKSPRQAKSTSGIDECSHTKLSDLDSRNFPSFLGLQHTQSKFETTPALLSGEWARPRCYVCCACGNRSEDPRSLATHDSTYHPFTQSSHYEVVGKDLLDADIIKHLYVPKSQMPKRLRPPRGTHTCTKCGKAVTAEELHPHILECAGDTQVVRRKNRNRLFGVRKRRSRVADEDAQNHCRVRKRARRNKRERLKRISLPPRVRTEVGDAETIKKMLENLPAKRHHRESSTLENPSNTHKVSNRNLGNMHKKRQAAKLDRKKRHAAAIKQEHDKIQSESSGLQLKSMDIIDNLVSDHQFKSTDQLPDGSGNKIPNERNVLHNEKTSGSSEFDIKLDKIPSERFELPLKSTDIKKSNESSLQNRLGDVKIPMESVSQKAESKDIKFSLECISPQTELKDLQILTETINQQTKCIKIPLDSISRQLGLKNIIPLESSCYEGSCTTDVKIPLKSKELEFLSTSNRLRNESDLIMTEIQRSETALDIILVNKSKEVYKGKTSGKAKMKKVDKDGKLDIANMKEVDKGITLSKAKMKKVDKGRTLGKAKMKKVDKDERLDKANMKEVDKGRTLDKANMKKVDKDSTLEEANIKEDDKARTLVKASIKEFDKDGTLVKANIKEIDKGGTSDKDNIRDLDKDETLVKAKIKKIDKDGTSDKDNIRDLERDETLFKANIKDFDKGGTSDKDNIRDLDKDDTLDKAHMKDVDKGGTSDKDNIRDLDKDDTLDKAHMKDVDKGGTSDKDNIRDLDKDDTLDKAHMKDVDKGGTSDKDNIRDLDKDDTLDKAHMKDVDKGGTSDKDNIRDLDKDDTLDKAHMKDVDKGGTSDKDNIRDLDKDDTLDKAHMKDVDKGGTSDKDNIRDLDKDDTLDKAHMKYVDKGGTSDKDNIRDLDKDDTLDKAHMKDVDKGGTSDKDNIRDLDKDDTLDKAHMKDVDKGGTSDKDNIRDLDKDDTLDKAHMKDVDKGGTSDKDNIRDLDKDDTLDKAHMKDVDKGGTSDKDNIRDLDKDDTLDKAHMKDVDKGGTSDKDNIRDLDKDDTLDKAHMKDVDKGGTSDKDNIREFDKDETLVKANMKKVDKGNIDIRNEIRHHQINTSGEENKDIDNILVSNSNTEQYVELVVKSCNILSNKSINNNFETKFSDSSVIIAQSSNNIKPPQLFKPYIDLVEREQEQQLCTKKRFVEPIKCTDPKDTTILKTRNIDVLHQPPIIRAEKSISRPHKPKRGLNECIALLLQGKFSDVSDTPPMIIGEQTAPMDLSIGKRDHSSSQIGPMMRAAIALSTCSQDVALDFSTRPLSKELKITTNTKFDMTNLLSPERNTVGSLTSPELKNTVETNTYSKNITNKRKIDTALLSATPKVHTRESATNNMKEIQATDCSISITKNVSLREITPIIVHSCTENNSNTKIVDPSHGGIDHLRPTQAASHIFKTISSEENIDSAINMPNKGERETFALREPLQSQNIGWAAPILKVGRENGTASLRAVRIKSASDKPRIVTTINKTSTTRISPETQNGINYITEKLKDVETSENYNPPSNDSLKLSNVELPITTESNREPSQNETIKPKKPYKVKNIRIANAVEDSHCVTKSTFVNHEINNDSSKAETESSSDLHLNTEKKTNEICESTYKKENEIIIDNITPNQQEISDVQSPSMALLTASNDNNKDSIELDICANSSKEVKDVDDKHILTSPQIEKTEEMQRVVFTSVVVPLLDTTPVETAIHSEIAPLNDDNTLTLSKLNDITANSENIEQQASQIETELKIEPIVVQNSEKTNISQKESLLIAINIDNLLVRLDKSEKENKQHNDKLTFKAYQSSKDLVPETKRPDDDSLQEIRNDDGSGEIDFSSVQSNKDKKPELEVLNLTEIRLSEPPKNRSPKKVKSKTTITNKKNKKTSPLLIVDNVESEKLVPVVSPLTSDNEVLLLLELPNEPIETLEKKPICSDSDDNVPLSVMVKKELGVRKKSIVRNDRKTRNKIEKPELPLHIETNKTKKTKLRNKRTRVSQSTNKPIENGHKHDDTEEFSQNNNGIEMISQKVTEISTENIINQVQDYDKKQKVEDLSVITMEKDNSNLPSVQAQTDKEGCIHLTDRPSNMEITNTSKIDEKIIETLQSPNTESVKIGEISSISTTQKRKIELDSPVVIRKKPRRRRQNIFREPKRYKKKPYILSITPQNTDLNLGKQSDTGITTESDKKTMLENFMTVSDKKLHKNKNEVKVNLRRPTRAVKRRKYISKDEESSIESRSTSQDTVQSDSQSQDSLYNVKENLDEYRIGQEPRPNRRFTRASKETSDFFKIHSKSNLKVDEDSTALISDLKLSYLQSESIEQSESREKHTLLSLLPENISETSTDSSSCVIRTSVINEFKSKEGTLGDNTESDEESVTLQQLAKVKKAGKLRTDIILKNFTEKSTDYSDSSSEPDFTKYLSRKIKTNLRNSSVPNTESALLSIAQSDLDKVPISDKELKTEKDNKLNTETVNKLKLPLLKNNTEELEQHCITNSINQPYKHTENQNDLTENKSTENVDGKQIDTYFENFGFFGQRQPRKSNLLASKKIHETFKANAEDESTQSNSTDAESIKYKRKRSALQSKKAIRSKNTRSNSRVRIHISRVSKEIISSQSDSESSASMPLMESKRAKRVSLIPDDHKPIINQESTKNEEDRQGVDIPPINNKSPQELSQRLFHPALTNAVTQTRELEAQQGSESKKIIKVGGKELTCDEAFFYEVCGLLRNADGKQAVRLVCGNIITLDNSDPKNIVISFDPPPNDMQATDRHNAVSNDSLISEGNQDMSAEDLERSVIKTLTQNRAFKNSTDGEPPALPQVDKKEYKADVPASPYIFEDKFDIIKRKSSARSASAVATGRFTSSSSSNRIGGNSAARSVSRLTSTAGSRTSTNSISQNIPGSSQRATAQTSNVASTPTTVTTPSTETVMNTSYRNQSTNKKDYVSPKIVLKAIEQDRVKTIIADILSQPTLIDEIEKVPTKAARKGFQGIKKGHSKCPFISRTHKHSLCKQRLRLFFAYRRKLAGDTVPAKGVKSSLPSRSTINPYDVYDFSDSEDIEEFDCITMAQINKLFDALNRTGADINYYTEETDSEEDFIYTTGHVYNKKRYGAMSTGSLRCSQQNTYPEKSAVVGKIFKNVARDSRNDNDKQGKRKVSKKNMKDIKTQSYQQNVEKNKEDKEKEKDKSSEEKSTLDELFDSLLVTTSTIPTSDLVHKPQSIEEHNALQSSDYSDSNVAPVEPEAGVARQRTRRKCAVGKQNVLAESWSSESEDEAPYSNYHSIRRKKPNRQPVATITTPPPTEPLQSQHVRDLVEASTSSSTNPNVRRERGIFRPAYSLSSSDDEEPPPQVQQHGWIVGNSHKKLVTMLAHAKGRKKEANKKEGDNDEYEFNE